MRTSANDRPHRPQNTPSAGWRTVYKTLDAPTTAHGDDDSVEIVTDGGVEQAPPDAVDEIGALVVDRDDDSDAGANRAAVVNVPPVPATEWEAYDGTTVAEDNPEYDPDADVIVVAFRDDLADAHPEWDGDEPLSLPLDCNVYAFPPGRLRRVGHLQAGEAADDELDDSVKPDSDPDATDADESDDTPLTDAQEQLRDRLDETSDVRVETDGDGEVVLVVDKLGVEHRIAPDGSVDGGPVADRLREIASDYLGGETA